MTSTLVIGGGISGLAAAQALLTEAGHVRDGDEVVVLEASDQYDSSESNRSDLASFLNA